MLIGCGDSPKRPAGRIGDAILYLDFHNPPAHEALDRIVALVMSRCERLNGCRIMGWDEQSCRQLQEPPLS
ncbi:hypothetical protein E0H35_37015, partial [Rhizobium leguminosarum bv. viciae]